MHKAQIMHKVHHLIGIRMGFRQVRLGSGPNMLMTSPQISVEVSGNHPNMGRLPKRSRSGRQVSRRCCLALPVAVGARRVLPVIQTFWYKR